MELALSFGWMAFVFWLILRAYGQRGLLPVLRPVAAIIRDPPNISVIVPARNEGHNLPRCLDGLLAQNYPPDRLTISVANDNPTDNTRALAASFASGFRQLKIIDCPPLPAHWC